MSFGDVNTYRFNVSEFFSSAAIIQVGSFDVLDEVDSTISGSLVYCQNLHYVQKAAKNADVSAVICPPALAGELVSSGKAIIVDGDPRRQFFEVYQQLQLSGAIAPQIDFRIGQDCVIHSTAVVSTKSKLGNRVVVGANSVIEDYCEIGDDVEIGANVVIGAEGLLTLRQADGRLMMIKHAGGVRISEGCQILSGAVIAKSLFRRFTFIGRHSQIGIMTNIGHGAHVGAQCVVSGNSVIAGRSRIGDGVWLGASVSVAQGLEIESGAQVKMGSVVVANVAAGAVVSGNFAVDHRVNMTRYLKGTG